MNKYAMIALMTAVIVLVSLGVFKVTNEAAPGIFDPAPSTNTTDSSGETAEEEEFYDNGAEIYENSEKYTEYGDYSSYIEDELYPYFETMREAGALKWGKDYSFSINFDYDLTCSYSGEVNESWQAHGYGEASCGGSESVKGTFMFGIPHGVIAVQRPDSAQSVYEMR